MNMEIWTEAAQFPEKVYINGIFVTVQSAIIACLIFRMYERVLLATLLAAAAAEPTAEADAKPEAAPEAGAGYGPAPAPYCANGG
jgi:hypothetical protein